MLLTQLPQKHLPVTMVQRTGLSMADAVEEWCDLTKKTEGVARR